MFSDDVLAQICSGDLNKLYLYSWSISYHCAGLNFCSAGGSSSMRRLTRPTTRELSRRWWPKWRVLVTIRTRWWTWRTTSSPHRCVTLRARGDLAVGRDTDGSLWTKPTSDKSYILALDLGCPKFFSLGANSDEHTAFVLMVGPCLFLVCRKPLRLEVCGAKSQCCTIRRILIHKAHFCSSLNTPGNNK